MNKEKILVVDDEQLIFDSIEDTLGDDYQLYHAKNGKIGLKLHKEHAPILIMLDIRMPVMNGFEFLKQIGVSQDDAYSVIMLSGHAVGAEINACYSMGVTAFLRKPFNIFELKGLVQQCISAKKQYQSLLQEKNFARSVIDYSIATIIAVDADRRIRKFNKAAEKMYGYSAEEVVGQPVSMIYGDGETSHRVGEEMRSKGFFSGEVVSKRKNGESFPVFVSATVLRDREGRIIGSVGSSRDLSKEREAEADKQAKKVAQVANQAKSQFLANMSHEIRTPMNAILGLSQLAMKTSLTDQQRDYLTKIQFSAHNLLGIINDILDFSKIEAGKLTMESVPFHIDHVLNNVSNVLSLDVKKKGLTFLLNCSPEIPLDLLGDPLRLGQVFTNLCNNAVKFTARGGRISVMVRVKEKHLKKVQLHCSIQDSGIGMTSEQMKALFSPFHQADSSTTRKYGGTGLGLTICKRIVERMHGQIWVESILDQGSVFHFTASFPRSGKPLPSSATKTLGEGLFVASYAREETGITPLLKSIAGARILLVEDNLINQQVAKEILEEVPFVVEVANHGLEAIQKVMQSPYDAVLMDLQMPEMDGFEATRQIRSTPRFKTLPIIAMTAHAMDTDQHKCLSAGMNDFTTKPIDVNRLFTTLLKWVEPGQRDLNTCVIPEKKDEGEKEPALPELPGIDLNSGLQRLGGNRKLFRKLWLEFKRDHACSIHEIKTLLDQDGDRKSVSQRVHTIKGIAGNLGAEALFHSARELERSIEQGDTREHWSEPLAQFEKALEQALVTVAILEPTDQAQEEPRDLTAVALPLNLEGVTALLVQLEQLLVAGDAKSEECVAMLKRHLQEKAEVQKELQQLEAAVDQFDFMRAQISMKTIAQTLHLFPWGNGTGT